MSARRVFALALVLFAGASPATETTPNRDWIPLQAGNRWSYRSSKETVVHPPGAPPQVTRASASDVEEVTRRLGQAFEVVRRSDQTSGAAASKPSVETIVISRAASGLVMTAANIDGAPVQILRPVILLPTSPEPGARWDGGAIEVQGLRFDVQGEVVGHEDVRTPAGEFPGCLVVRFKGRVSGALQVEPGVSVAAEDATLESLEWYAAGVGMVRSRTSHHMKLRLPDGRSVVSDETEDRVLDAYQAGGIPAAPAR